MKANSRRRDLIATREALPPSVVTRNSTIIGNRVWRIPALQRAARIAVYSAVRGEASCEHIINAAWARRRQVFLPVIVGENLRFARHNPHRILSRNRYGIPEPNYPKRDLVHAHDIDVMIMPLVAFDSRGNRLGMGGGYYDRALRRANRCLRWRRPILIGIAHELQKTAPLKACSWDVPMHFVVTEQQTYTFSHQATAV